MDELEASRQVMQYHLDSLVKRKIAKYKVEKRPRAYDGAEVKVKVYWIS